MGYQWIDDEDDDDETQQPAGKPADLPEPARKHMRKVERENAELKKQLDALAAAQRKTSVSDVLKAQGYDPKIAAFIPPTVDASEEAVTKWLGEHATVFAKTTTTDVSANSGAEIDTIPLEVAQALGTVTNISANAQSPERVKDLMAQMNDPNLTVEKLDALVRANSGRF